MGWKKKHSQNKNKNSKKQKQKNENKKNLLFHDELGTILDADVTSIGELMPYHGNDDIGRAGELSYITEGSIDVSGFDDDS